MRFVDAVGAGFMMMGLVLGAMTGAIAMLLIPVAIGAVIAGAASWYRHARRLDGVPSKVPYPPYGY